jgi:uncharacterized membrane protein YdjX (TVP38/TMEM64 family)
VERRAAIPYKRRIAAGMPSSPENARPDAPRRRRPARLAAAAVAVALLVVAGRAATPLFAAFAAWLDRLGPLAPLVYVGGYVVATVAFVPGALPTLAAGALFGLAEGTLYAFIGETLGGIAAFLIARRVARPMVERRLVRDPRFHAIDRAVAAEGGKIVFLLRLSPLVPFNMLNYVLGVTCIRFRAYALASIGMLPGAALYVYYGKLAGDVTALAAGVAPARGAGYWAVLVFGLAATALVTTLLARVARRALREARVG